MFTSIRSRLWLSFTLLILCVLCVVGTGLIIYLVRNPPSTRQAYQRLHIVAAFIQQREAVQLAQMPADRLQLALQRSDQAFNARIAILDASLHTIADSQADLAAPIPALELPVKLPAQPNLQFTDNYNERWLYTIRTLADGSFLLVASQPPQAPLRQALREELLPPLLQAGAVALALALLLAMWLSRWISAPLQRITTVASHLTASEDQRIPLEGPAEVRSLALSFNEMSDRIRSSQQAQRDFVANVSHELKTPLTSIQGFAQAILDGTANSPAQIQQAAEVIHAEAGRMNRLALDLLDLARMDSGIADFKREALDLTHLLSDVVAKFTPQANLGKVTLRAEIPPLPALIGDADRLVQVFTNLVDNAIKHTPEGGLAQIKARYDAGFIEISISDTGAGIASEDLSRIFERFYQVDKSRRGGNQHGVGLGLAISKEIIQAHRGSIAAYSIPERGSTFTVRLPVARPDDSTLARKKG